MSRGVARDFDRRLVALDLLEGRIEHPQRLLRLEPSRIVVLRHENGKEQRAESAFLRAREVELAVGFALADVAAVIEDAIDGVDVPVEHEPLLRHRGQRGQQHRGERHAGIRHIIETWVPHGKLSSENRRCHHDVLQVLARAAHR